MHNEVWVFGYGSLCWSPGFDYSDRIVGYIKGYKRRFWQGNTVQRGTVEKPGRVVTLVENEHAETWGVAFKITGEAALDYLQVRECILGGYMTTRKDFYPRDGSQAFPTVLYIATEENDQWAGKASSREMAGQIIGAQGVNGHNVEYLFQLAQFMRNEVPEVWDNHLFELENCVIDLLESYNDSDDGSGCKLEDLEKEVLEERIFSTLEGHSIPCIAS